MMPATPITGSKLDWSVSVEKGAGTVCTYWITVTANAITFEGPYAILIKTNRYENYNRGGINRAA